MISLLSKKKGHRATAGSNRGGGFESAAAERRSTCSLTVMNQRPSGTFTAVKSAVFDNIAIFL